MNILFLSLLDFGTFEERNIYTDLLREFIRNGHKVCSISPVEKRKNQKTRIIPLEENYILKLKIGNTQKVNLVEKGISTLRIEHLFIQGIKNYFSEVKFDLVLYATPPVTFAKVIQFVKKRDGAKSYLLLKDIFPQNSVDLGMLCKTGVKSFIYKHFRQKEKTLYALSDRIGCMSQANLDYLLKNNPDISPDKVEVCPNSVEPIDMRISDEERTELRKKYNLPLDKKIFVYGGNLGRPQDIPFVVECLRVCNDISELFFVIAGSGTDKHFLEEYMENERPKHVKIFGQILKDEYDKMIACCDVGLIFLDHHFTIPNFPSRLLSYMQAGLPVLACTDSNTDVGKIIVEGGFGWWCESNSVNNFISCIMQSLNDDLKTLGHNGQQYLNERYNVAIAYKQIKINF